MRKNDLSRAMVNGLRFTAQEIFFSIRWLSGKAVLLQDKIAAQSDVRAMKNIEHVHLRPLAADAAYAAEMLRDALQGASDLQDAASTTKAHMKLPRPGQPMPPTDISKLIEEISLELGKTFGKIAKNRITRDLKAAAKDRISKASVESLKDAKHFLLTGHHDAAHTVTHQAGIASVMGTIDGADIADTTTVAASTADLGDHMNALDLKIVGALDSTEIVDGLAGLQDTLIETFPIASAAMDMVGDFALVPGMLSSCKSIIREINLLTKNETTFEDAFKATFLPVLVKTATVAGAVALEVATGGTFLGIFVITAVVLNAVGGRKLIKDQATAQWNELHGYQQHIHRRKQEAFVAISNDVAKNFDWLPNLLANCPKLGSQEEMRVFISAIAKAYATEHTTVAQFVLTDCARRVDRVPAPNWIDRALKIDRTAARIALYRKTANAIVTRLNANADEFDKTAKIDTTKAVASIVHQRVIPNGEVTRTIETLETWLPATLHKHTLDVAIWQRDCSERWNYATQKTAEVTTRESIAVTALVDSLHPRMEVLRQGLRANMQRLGQKIDI